LILHAVLVASREDKPMKKLACSTFILVCFFFNQAFACTTFCLRGKGEVLFGRNYDWDIGDALIFVNKRGVAKTSTEEPKPAKWVSKYGSVTFNQYGRENPTGGMNEAGLVVEQMWLDETEYSKDPTLPAIGTQEWMQYLLDTSATTTEAIKSAERVRIVTEVPVHYLISDKTGNSAAIEFVSGKMVVHTDDSLPVATLTNDTYDNSIKVKSSAAIEKATSSSSLDRFVRAAQRTEAFSKEPKDGREAVNYAFDVLSNAAQHPGTVWSIVYDIKRGWIYFRTAASPQIKSIDTRAFDYSCGTPVKMFDMNAKDSGDVTAKFTSYTRKANRDLIEHSFSGTPFLKNVPPMLKNQLAAYPEYFKCVR
jgi:penicillin V acylase-like amidase (Ntn superfamily)